MSIAGFAIREYQSPFPEANALPDHVEYRRITGYHNKLRIDGNTCGVRAVDMDTHKLLGSRARIDRITRSSDFFKLSTRSAGSRNSGMTLPCSR